MAAKPSPHKRAKVGELPEPVPGQNFGEIPTDVVTVVSRNGNGEPRYAPGFKVLVPHDATEDELRAAWNDADGELPPADVLVTYFRAERRRSEV